MKEKCEQYKNHYSKKQQVSAVKTREIHPSFSVWSSNNLKVGGSITAQKRLMN